MVFSSFIFLFAFLPLTLAAYYLCPPRGRNAVLLAASLLFYAWGAPRFVLVLVGATWADWMISRAIAAAPSGSALRRRWLAGSLVLNLGLLGWFKYATFATTQLSRFADALGFAGESWVVEVALPLGISFFTFHKISYLVDVYRGVSAPASSFGLCLLYISLFPAPDRRAHRPLPRRGPAAARAHPHRRPLPVGVLPVLPGPGQEGAGRERAGGGGRRRVRCAVRGASTPGWRGSACWPTASRSTSTSPATPTWRSASAACSASSSWRTSTAP